MSDTLRTLQERLQSDLLRDSRDMLVNITDARPNAAARLAIYSTAYRLRLLEALAADYPALHTLAGDELFERIGRAYIDAHPSTHFSIRWFGRHLSEFLATTAPFRATPALSEMAALEWALSLAFDAADEAVLDVGTLAALPAEHWPELRLRFHASVQRRDFGWNVPELWTAIDQQGAPESPTPYPQKRAWLIWRRELQTCFRPLDSDEAWAFDCMRAGECFAEMCAGLGERIDATQASLRAATYLKTWVSAGLITP